MPLIGSVYITVDTRLSQLFVLLAADGDSA